MIYLELPQPGMATSTLDLGRKLGRTNGLFRYAPQGNTHYGDGGLIIGQKPGLQGCSIDGAIRVLAHLGQLAYRTPLGVETDGSSANLLPTDIGAQPASPSRHLTSPETG